MQTIITSNHSLTLVSTKALHVVRVDFDADYLAADVFHQRSRNGCLDFSNTRVTFHLDPRYKVWDATGPVLNYKAGRLFCKAYNDTDVWEASFADKFLALHSLYCPDNDFTV